MKMREKSKSYRFTEYVKLLDIGIIHRPTAMTGMMKKESKDKFYDIYDIYKVFPHVITSLTHNNEDTSTPERWAIFVKKACFFRFLYNKNFFFSNSERYYGSSHGIGILLQRNHKK
jgi:hypothetical protein